MTAPNEARKAITMRFLDRFKGVERERIALDNEDFKAPENGDWVRFVVRHNGRAQDTLGCPANRRFRSAGIVFVQVFTEAASSTTMGGTEKADELCKEIADIFDAVSFDGLDFQAAVCRESGPDGRWYIHIVEAPFEYDEIK